jgi:4-alpha-glucanotransferase
MREQLDVPGMAVLQFLFDRELDLDGATRGRVLYTGTHDQTTLLGWWGDIAEGSRARVREALERRSLSAGDDRSQLLALAASTPAPLVIAQMQDLLGLPAAARMNTPGRAAGNWRWQMPAGATTVSLARQLRALAADADRLA